MKRILYILGLVALVGCASKPPDKAKPLTRVTVTGDSMEPTLHSGQMVELVQVPFSSLQVGDIVVFEHGSGRVIHRIRQISRDRLWTKGDNNAMRDGWWVHANEVVGVVK